MKLHRLRRMTLVIGLISSWQLGVAQVETASAPSDTSFEPLYSQIQEQHADLAWILGREGFELITRIWAELQHQAISSTQPAQEDEVGCRASWTYQNPAVERDDQFFSSRRTFAPRD